MILARFNVFWSSRWSGQQVLLGFELATDVKQVEVVEWHTVSVASEKEHTVANDYARMTVASWGPLALGFGLTSSR